MWRLTNPVMNYDWGSEEVIPEFLGEAAGRKPVAELWFGAHLKASSVLQGLDGEDVPLLDALQRRPELLGEHIVERFGIRLPFLVKLLAARKPLSLQVHPPENMAADGYAREEAEGVRLDDPERTYKDQHHKPEVMIALGPTETLTGFRAVGEARALLGRIGLPWADRVAELVGDDMRPAFELLLDAGAWDGDRAEVLARCRELSGTHRAYGLVGTLDEYFPGDSGACAPLLLNVAEYTEGEALFVPTGQVHAHVSGFGLEVMAASDNVIRAGLTHKHVDGAALFRAVNPGSVLPDVVDVRQTRRLSLPVDEFEVSVLEAGELVAAAGPKIAVSLDAAGVVLGGLKLPRGQAVFVPDGEAPAVEQGEVWVVGVPLAG